MQDRIKPSCMYGFTQTDMELIFTVGGIRELKDWVLNLSGTPKWGLICTGFADEDDTVRSSCYPFAHGWVTPEPEVRNYIAHIKHHPALGRDPLMLEDVRV